MGGGERSLDQALLTKKTPAEFFVVPFLSICEKISNYRPTMFVYVLVETIFCRWEMLALLPSEAAGMSTRSSLAATTDPWLICHFLSNL